MESQQSFSPSHRKLELDDPSELSHLEARGPDLYTSGKGTKPWATQVSSVRAINAGCETQLRAVSHQLCPEGGGGIWAAGHITTTIQYLLCAKNGSRC